MQYSTARTCLIKEQNHQGTVMFTEYDLLQTLVTLELSKGTKQGTQKNNNKQNTIDDCSTGRGIERGLLLNDC
jgi:hypothetical protein